MANALTRDQLLQTWQGLQSLIKGVPASFITTTEVEGLSDDALLARIDAQQIAIDNNAAVGPRVRPAVDLNAPLDIIEDGDTPPTPQGARQIAIGKLKTAIANPAEADMGFVHALLGSYAEGHEFTIPDLAFDDQLSESELAAAQEITTRLEAGENAPQIEAAFTASATTIEEEQRRQAELEEQRRAAELAAARQQASLETSVDAHLAAMGYITPEQIGALDDTQRANAFTAFMREHSQILTTPGTAAAGIGTLSQQQAAALNAADGYAVTPAALTVLTSGRAGEQLATEVENWLESGDTAQIMMAQATLGLEATGVINELTRDTATTYIHAGYPTSLTDIPFLQNNTGGLNSDAMFDAANRGTIYVPTIEELRAAGVDEATLESIAAARPAAELTPLRDALAGKDFSTFTAEDQAVWVADTQEELIALQLMNDPALYSTVIQARNNLAPSATLEVTLAVNTEADAVDLAVVDLNNPPDSMIIPAALSDKVEGDEPLSVVEERSLAANPLGLSAPDENVLGGYSEAAGAYYNNAAVAKTADGTLVFEGPDVSLNMVVAQINPADDHAMTMEEALRSVQALQDSQQELFLRGASPSGSDDLGFLGGRLARELGYEPDHQFDFNNPRELEDLLTGVYAYNNAGAIPDASGNMLQSFVNSQDASVIAMRDSITRVAEGNPRLTSAPVMVAEGDADPDAPANPGVDETVTAAIPAEPVVAAETGGQSLWVNSGIELPGMSHPTDEFFNPNGSFNGSMSMMVDPAIGPGNFNIGAPFDRALNNALIAPNFSTGNLNGFTPEQQALINLNNGPQ